MPTYVVTGTNRGIGLEYVRQLAADQTNTIVATVRNLKAEMKELHDIVSKASDRVHIVQCDMTSATDLNELEAKVAKALGGKQINMLINNAAINQAGGETGTTVSSESIMKHVEANVAAPSRVLQACLSSLAPGAIIANISSGAGSQRIKAVAQTPPGITAYSISKSALNMLTILQAYEVKGRAIIVAVDPGHVKTEMGGPKAVIEIPDSARAVLSLLHGLKPEDNGKFYKFDGSTVEW